MLPPDPLSSTSIRALGTLGFEGRTRFRPKPLLLLTYLGLEGPTPRWRLVELFGAGARDPADAFATTLRRARDGLLAHAGDESPAAAVSSDAVAFRERALAGDHASALSLYRGSFLAGLRLSLGVELEEWCMHTREELAALAVRCHVRAAGVALAAGDREAAARHALLAARAAPEEVLEAREIAQLRHVCARSRLAVTDDLQAIPEGSHRATRGTRQRPPPGSRRPTPAPWRSEIPADRSLRHELLRHDWRALERTVRTLARAASRVERRSAYRGRYAIAPAGTCQRS